MKNIEADFDNVTLQERGILFTAGLKFSDIWEPKPEPLHRETKIKDDITEEVIQLYSVALEKS